MEKNLFSTDDINFITGRKDVLRRRIKACIFDYFLFFAVSFLLPLGEVRVDGTYEMHGVITLYPLLLWFVYFIVVEREFSGTLGKRLFGIRVESSDGGRLSYGQVLKRRVADFIEITWCFGLIAYFNASNNFLNRRLGDIWAKTNVVRRR